MYRFTDQELKQLDERGVSEYSACEQLNILSEGAPYADVAAPAVIGNGINVIAEEDKLHLTDLYMNARLDSRISKFVPASGAATRMFNDLIRAYNGDMTPSALKTLENIKSFAFYEDLEKLFLFRNMDIDRLIDTGDWKQIIEYMLFAGGLNYSDKPKALIRFTQYDGSARTALEEHIYESISLCSDKDNAVKLHFTLSEKYIGQVRDLVADLKEDLRGIDLQISYSSQKLSTDTLAIYTDTGEPVKDSSGDLIFRPGGHGALIENLNETEGDIVIIKNIDNVVNRDYRAETEEYLKLLTGYLISIEQKIRSFLSNIDTLSQDSIEEIKFLARKYFCIDLEKQLGFLENYQKNDFLFSFLNRPIRVCGMIKNTGEPGGGPFHVMNRNGMSLQIVESSQIDMNDPEKKNIFLRSTHFNPVLMVCSLKDYRNLNFDLRKFVDKDSYFISGKTFGGRNIKALELPGLWNGAMSGWLTSFVEVPLETFCPAKTVNDLLKKERFPKPIGVSEQ